MRGIVWAAIAAAAIVAAAAAWRFTDDTDRRLVDEEAMPGTWVRVTMESCRPPLPTRLTLEPDGRYRTPEAAGDWMRDEDGRYVLREGAFDFPHRIFRAEQERLELLNRLGCKATYARVANGGV